MIQLRFNNLYNLYYSKGITIYGTTLGPSTLVTPYNNIQTYRVYFVFVCCSTYYTA